MKLSYERLCGCGEDKDESWEDSFSFKQQEMHKKAFDSATTDPCYHGAPSQCSHRCMAHSGTVNVAAECWNSPIKCWKDKSNSEEFTPACSGSFHVSRGPPPPLERLIILTKIVATSRLSGCTSPYFLFSYTQTTCLLSSNDKNNGQEI